MEYKLSLRSAPMFKGFFHLIKVCLIVLSNVSLSPLLAIEGPKYLEKMLGLVIPLREDALLELVKLGEVFIPS